MPNTLTSIFTSSPNTEPVEAPHPNTGVYVLGTQLANLTWQVIHTGVTKTATAPTMIGRLKNFPAITASILASGNVLNNVLAAPTGSAATGTNATTISVAVSSIANQTAYRLLSSDTAGGTYTQIYQGVAASFAHTGLAASQTKFYRWQYVGGGFYDDSALSAVFSGATPAAGLPVLLVAVGDSLTFGNDIPASAYPAQLLTLLGSGYEMRNNGVNGQPLSAALATPSVLNSLTAQLAAVTAANYSKVIFLVDGGANDFRLLGQNYPTQDAVELTYNARRTAHEKIKAAGFLSLAMSHTNYNFLAATTPATLNATIRANMVGENAQISGRWQSDLLANGYVDLSIAAKIGWDIAQADQFQADGVHLTAAGNLTKATLMVAAVQALVAGQSYGAVSPLPAAAGRSVNDNENGWTYSAGWVVTDASTGTPAAFIYSSGTAHTPPSGVLGSTLFADYVLPQNCAEIEFWWPAQTIAISVTVSVAGGAAVTIATVVQASNEQAPLRKGAIQGPFTAGQVLRIANTPGATSSAAVVDKIVLNATVRPAPVAIEETDAGWTYSGAWQTQTGNSFNSAGAIRFLGLGVSGTATRTLAACASVEIWLPSPTGTAYTGDYFIDGVYRATAIASAASTQASALILTLAGPFTAGQVLTVSTPTVARNANVASHYTVVDKIVLNF